MRLPRTRTAYAARTLLTAGKHRPAVICEGVGGMDGLVSHIRQLVAHRSIPFHNRALPNGERMEVFLETQK